MLVYDITNEKSFDNIKNWIRNIEEVRVIVSYSLHVMSLPPCWRTITKDYSLASIVSSTNMATTSLSFDSLGIDCKASIDHFMLGHCRCVGG